MIRPDTRDYQHLFLTDAPMIDLRAPCEFAQGSFPSAVSLPLMDDEERRKVGTCYKQHGQEAAIKLGHKLVTGEVRDQRMAAWQRFVQAHPQNGYLFCFRGGLRSRTVKQWLQEAGTPFPLVEGGYKAMRRYLIDTIDRVSIGAHFIVLGGLTGCNKTGFVSRHPDHVDLEFLAHHRGSSFGRFPTPQPSQISFENRLAVALLHRESAQSPFILVEDEGRIIGSLNLPLTLHTAMKSAPLVLLTETFDQRVENILDDYVIRMVDLYFADSELSAWESRFDAFSAYLLGSLDKLRKRLGGERHHALRAVMQEALACQRAQNNIDFHRRWITELLRGYYDPMYAYQLGQKKERVVFEGDAAAVTAYLSEYRGNLPA